MLSQKALMVALAILMLACVTTGVAQAHSGCPGPVVGPGGGPVDAPEPPLWLMLGTLGALVVFRSRLTIGAKPA